MTKFNEQQLKIINIKSGKCAVVAGAGSGKSTTMVEFIARKNEKTGLPLDSFFVVTFTKKAAKDLKQKIKKRLKLASTKKLWIGTFHKLGYTYLKMHKKLDFSLMPEDDCASMIKRFYRKELDNYDRETLVDQMPDLSQDTVADILNYHRNNQVEFSRNKVGEFLSKVSTHFVNFKKETKQFDFQDILEQFKFHVETDTEFKNKFSWVISDESQDNELIQFQLLDVLTTKNRIVVGDRKQAIYEWRGARPELFNEIIEEADQVYELSYNYRSSQDIINLANGFVGGMPEFAKETLISTKPLFQKPSLYILHAEKDEDLEVAQIIRSIERDIERGIPPKEIAILCRSVRSISFKYALELKARKIPYVIRGGNDDFMTKYIRKASDILSCASKPTFNNMHSTLCVIPKVGEKTADKYAEELVSNPLALANMTKYSGTFEHRKLLQLFASKSKQERLNHTFDLCSAFISKNYDDKGDKVGKLKDFLDFVGKYKTIQAALDALTLDKKDDPNENKGVVISTLHQAKGLEWDSVHLCRLKDKVFPAPYNDNLKEEERLFYVGITRAKKYLRMYHCGTYSDNISKFLFYFDDSLINIIAQDVQREKFYQQKQNFEEFNKLREEEYND